MAISSEKTNKSAAVNKAKKLPFLGRKIKRKTADLPELLSESDILGGEDKLSVSMILAEVKERTGDLSQMVRLSFAYSWCESLLDQFSFVKDESVVEVHSNSYIQIRGGARNTHLSFSQRPFLRNPGSQPGMEQESSWLDRLAKKFCFYAVVAVFIQSLSTILSNNDLDEVRLVTYSILSRPFHDAGIGCLCNIALKVEFHRQSNFYHSYVCFL
jgi:hypothetical protein